MNRPSTREPGEPGLPAVGIMRLTLLFEIDDGVLAPDRVIAAGNGDIAEQGDDPGIGIVDAVIAAGDVGRGRHEDIAQGVDPTDPGAFIVGAGRSRPGARLGCRRFCRWCRKRGPGGLWLVLGHVSCQHVGPDAFDVLFYRDRIAAGDRRAASGRTIRGCRARSPHRLPW